MRHLMLMSLVLVVSCGGEKPEVERPQSAPRKPRTTLTRPQIEPGKINVQPPTLPKPKGLVLTLKNYPRTSGSTSAEPMGVWVACRLLGKECEWTGGEVRLIPFRRNVVIDAPADAKRSELFSGVRDSVAWVFEEKLYRHIAHTSTHGSYKNLIAGRTDLIYECRRPSEDEQKRTKFKKVELDIRPVALDAFVFIRNKDNPVKDLTLAQVKDIYTRGADGKAKIGNWNEAGGPDAKINAYIRNRNSGSQETMMSLVMKERPIVGERGMTGSTMSGPYNRLHGDKTGIGFTFFYYQHHMAPQPFSSFIYSDDETQQVEPKEKKPPVEMFAIDGVMPSRATIAAGTYPLVTEVYVVTRKDLKPGHPAAKLRDWLLTAEGQKIVAETGYVPITAKK